MTYNDAKDGGCFIPASKKDGRSLAILERAAGWYGASISTREVEETMIDHVTLYLKDPRDTLKMIRETLCVAQTALGSEPRSTEHRERMGRIINEIDRQRPLGPDGKHGNLHTVMCGCHDADMAERAEACTRR